MAMHSATCHGQSLVWTQHMLVARAMRAITVTLTQRFSDQVGAKAQAAGMAEDICKDCCVSRTERKLVIDTNLWISRLLMPGGTAANAVDHALAWGIPLVSEATLAELSNVLARPKFDRYVSRTNRQRFLQLLGGIVRIVTVTQQIAACRDPKDDKFLDVALSGGAQMLLTGDLDLLALHPFHGIHTLTPHDFLRQPLD